MLEVHLWVLFYYSEFGYCMQIKINVPKILGGFAFVLPFVNNFLFFSFLGIELRMLVILFITFLGLIQVR